MSVDIDRRAGLLLLVSRPRKIWISKSRSSGSSFVTPPGRRSNGDTGTSDGSVIMSAGVNPEKSSGECEGVVGGCDRDGVSLDFVVEASSKYSKHQSLGDL